MRRLRDQNGEVEERLAARAREQRAAMRLAILAAVTGALSAVGLAGLSGWFLAGAGLAAAAGAALAFNYLLPSALIRQAAIFRTGARYFERLFAHRAALFALAGLRADLFRLLAAQPAAQALALSGGEAASRLVEDVDAIENRLVRAPSAPAGVAAGVLAVVVAWLAAPRAGVGVAALLLALVPLSNALRTRFLEPAAEDTQAALGALKAAVVSAIDAAAEIRLMGLETKTAALLADEAARLDAARSRYVRAEAGIAALVTLFAGLAAGMVLLLAAGAPVALVVAAALAAQAAVEAQGGLVRTAIERARVAAGLARLEATAGPKPSPPAAIATLAPGPLWIRVAGQEVEVEAGGRLLVAGPSGSGKTRLLLALAGLGPANSAEATLGGVPLARLSEMDRRRLFALAPQAPMLMAGTIAENLALARPGVTEAEMWEALEIAGLADVVRARPGGLGALLGDGGRGLSGGEAKRLALARALLARRPWLLLDEPTEGLDAETEAEVVARLDTWLGSTETGLVLVSHRPAPRALVRGSVLHLAPGLLALRQEKSLPLQQRSCPGPVTASQA
ncbi:ATP-binding cassette domain-containing protein [Thermaurantiacus sp.]